MRGSFVLGGRFRSPVSRCTPSVHFKLRRRGTKVSERIRLPMVAVTTDL